MAGHCARATFGAAAEAGEPIAYGTVDAAMFEEAVTAYRNNPIYLVANMPLLRALTPEQLAEAIERLDMTHYSDLHPVVIKGSAIAGLVGRALRRSRSWRYAGIAYSPSRSRSPGWMRKGGFSCPRCRPTRYGGAAASSTRSTKSCSCTGIPDYDPYETKRHDAIAGRILQERRFEHGGRARYAYLVQGDPRRNGADYVSFDAETGISRNRYDAFRTDPADFLDFQDFCANGG
ncbi:MAG TPA: hypothetical protein DDW98_11730, partial [Gammaproteobacteria bacterium]|nr:hypothetical protein [Gammaproteobacteria bacterium]